MKRILRRTLVIAVATALTLPVSIQAQSAVRGEVGKACPKIGAKGVNQFGAAIVCVAAPKAATKPATKKTTTKATAAGVWKVVLPKGAIKIGFSAATTGTNALLGQSYRGGVAFAVSQINSSGGVDGHLLDVVTADGGDTNTGWVNSMNVLESEKPVMIIGHPHSSGLLAQSETIKRVGVPYFFSGGSPALTQEKLQNQWIFRISPSDGISAVAAMNYIVDDLKFTKIGILHDNTAYGIDGAAVMVSTLAKRGITPVGNESHELFATDVSAQLLKLRSAGAQIIVGWSIPVVTATTVRQLKELQIGVPYMGGRSMALTAVLGLTTPAQMDGQYGAVDNAIAADPAAAAFVKAYKRYAGKDADFFTAQYYDLVYMIKDWVLQAGTNPDALRKAILATSNRKGVGSGVYSFNKTLTESNYSAQIVKYSGETVSVLKTITVNP